MIKVWLDAGHGGNDPGAVGFVREKDINLIISNGVGKFLENNYICKVGYTRKTDKAVSLAKRCEDANKWGADLFVSLHSNAGGGYGYEDFIHSSLSNTGATAKIRNEIHAVVARVWTDEDRRNRGKKKANFYVLRNTKMAAVLLENGFVDNRTDAALLQNSSFIAKLIRAVAVGIANGVALEKKPVAPPSSTTGDGIFYRVVTGSFKEMDNAQKRVKDLEKAGFDSFIVAHKESRR